MPADCLVDLEESPDLADSSRGNSTGSHVPGKGPSMDQGAGIPPIPWRGQLKGLDDSSRTTEDSSPSCRQTLVREAF